MYSFLDFSPVNEIGFLRITTLDFSESQRIPKIYPVLSSDDIRIPRPGVRSTKELGVSWGKSVQEYAGSLGHVCHSGDRPVSDIFRSGSSDYSGFGYTEAGVPTLSSLKMKLGYGEESVDPSLVADWDIAVRMMEEFSKTDRKLKRAGAIKVKRNNEGGTDPSKDEIGSSFSNGGGAKWINDGGTRLTEIMLEDLENEDNESKIYSSLESLGYEPSGWLD